MIEETLQYNRKLAWCWLYIQAPAFLYDEAKTRYGLNYRSSYTGAAEAVILSLIFHPVYIMGRVLHIITPEVYFPSGLGSLLALSIISIIVSFVVNSDGLSGVLCSIHNQSLILKKMVFGFLKV